MSDGDMRCQTKEGYCPNPLVPGACLCVMHIDERFKEYAQPLDISDYMPDLVDR